MKTYMLPIAIATLAVSAIASAQTDPNAQTPPSSSSSPPSSSMQTPSSSSSYSSSSTDSKQALKDCVAKQKATNPQISETDAKRACGKTDAK
jgi:hypothetical protein